MIGWSCFTREMVIDQKVLRECFSSFISSLVSRLVVYLVDIYRQKARKLVCNSSLGGKSPTPTHRNRLFVNHHLYLFSVSQLFYVYIFIAWFYQTSLTIMVSVMFLSVFESDLDIEWISSAKYLIFRIVTFLTSFLDPPIVTHDNDDSLLHANFVIAPRRSIKISINEGMFH